MVSCPDVEEALVRFREQYPIMMGYLNSDIGQEQNPQIQQVANLLMEFRLVDLLQHFCQRMKVHHLETWFQVLKDRLLRSRCDHILGLDRRIFEKVGIWDTWNFLSQAHLLNIPRICHRSYLWGSRN